MVIIIYNSSNMYHLATCGIKWYTIRGWLWDEMHMMLLVTCSYMMLICTQRHRMVGSHKAVHNHWLCERAYYSLALIPYPSAFFSFVLFSPIIAALRSAPDFSTLLLCPTTHTYTTHIHITPFHAYHADQGCSSLSLPVRWLCFFFCSLSSRTEHVFFLPMANVPCLFSRRFPFTRQLLLLASSFFPSIPASTPFAVI